MVSLFVLLCLLAVLLALILILALLPLKLQIRYRRQDQNDRLELNLFFAGIKYQLALPAVNLSRRFSRPVLKILSRLEGRSGSPPVREKKRFTMPDLPVLRRKYRRWHHLGKSLWPAARYLLRHTKPTHVRWRTLIGLSDAAATGMAVGALWALQGALLTAVYRLLGPAPARPAVAVVPNFTAPALATDLECIFAIRAGYIFIAALHAAFLYVSAKMTGRLKV